MAIKECTKTANVLAVTNIMNTLTRFLVIKSTHLQDTLLAQSLAREDIRFQEDIFSGKEKK